MLLLLWRLVRKHLLERVSLREHPELVALVARNEPLVAFSKLPAERLLLRWLRHMVGRYLDARPPPPQPVDTAVATLSAAAADGVAIGLALHEALAAARDSDRRGAAEGEQQEGQGRN